MKGKKLHDLWKRTAMVSLSVALLTLTAGCGEKKEEADAQLPEYSYVPKYIELDEEQNYYQSVIVGNALYNQVYEFDEETMTAAQRLVKYPIEDGRLGEESTILTFSQNDGVQSFVVDDSENLYCVMERYPELTEEEAWTEDYYNNRQILLCKYDSQGNMVYEQEITKRVNETQVGPLGLGGSTTVLGTVMKIGPQRASGVRIVCLRPCCCFEPRKASVDF